MPQKPLELNSLRSTHCAGCQDIPSTLKEWMNKKVWCEVSRQRYTESKKHKHKLSLLQ